ncbi:MAG: hypothetical protein J0H68_08235 [Sphingobacteriia bacterium]|nr:hypothetical protein [Sphingobacteriia bacterium]
MADMVGGINGIVKEYSHYFSSFYDAYANEGGESQGKSEGHGEDAKKKDEKPPKPSTTDPKRYNVKSEPSKNALKLYDQDKCTPADFEMLSKLQERREQLDLREKAIKDRENITALGDKKISLKIAELKGVRDEIKELVKQYKKEQDQQIDSLVKIYSNMKPKDAARILEELDMDTLLQVVNRMKEAKSAPILAQMNPTKARDLTIELANQKKAGDLPCLCDN